eukprot:130261-Pyramimonas_sp.AAC.1
MSPMSPLSLLRLLRPLSPPSPLSPLSPSPSAVMERMLVKTDGIDEDNADGADYDGWHHLYFPRPHHENGAHADDDDDG